MFKDCLLTRNDFCLGSVQLLNAVAIALALTVGVPVFCIFIRKIWKRLTTYPFSKEECPWRGTLPGVHGTQYVLSFSPSAPGLLSQGLPMMPMPVIQFAKCYGCGVVDYAATEATPHP